MTSTRLSASCLRKHDLLSGGGSSLRESCPGKGEGLSFGVTIVLPGEDEEDGDFLRGYPANMAGPDLADVGRGGTSLGIYSFSES